MEKCFVTRRLCILLFFCFVAMVQSNIVDDDLLDEDVHHGVRVKRQAQALLTLLQQNPALLQQLQQNPQIIQNVQAQLAIQQQQQQQPGLLSPVSLVGNIPVLQAGGGDDAATCASLRKQNKLLRQMLLSVAGEDHTGGSGNSRDLLLAATTNPAQELFERAVGGGAGGLLRPQTEFVTSVLVTPTATWSTEETTTTYVTTVTQTASTEVPILLRGNKVITTILEEQIQTVTATEVQTSSTLVTPTPTWSTFLMTVTPSINLLADTFGSIQAGTSSHDEDFRPRKRNNQPVVEAKVVEIDESKVTPKQSKLDRFREAYGAYFASSAQRSAQRFGDSFKRIGADGDELLEEFDQQVQPAINRPVYVPSPVGQQRHKEFTLYFSGSVPGEVTTKVTRLPVDESGRPIRAKREAEDISPSPVEAIDHTPTPIFQEPPLDLQSGMTEIQGSMEACPGSVVTTTVTLKETVIFTLRE